MESGPPINQSPVCTSQHIWFEPPSTVANSDDYVVYMIPGNPCLMAYYQLFVSTLFNSLNKKLASRKLSAHVGGYTLPGFQLKPGHLNGAPLPASLKSQVRHTEELIKIALDEHIHKGNEGDDTTKRPKVIFIAHSIGAYIALEILRRRADGHNDLSGVDIVGGVFVCPTVTHIAQSRNGGRVNFLAKIPGFPAIVGMLAKFMTFLLPFSAIYWFASVLGRMPPHIAQATAEFLKGPTAVQQALHMTRDGCREIKEDTWTEAVWGSPDASTSQNIPLKFYFAEHDVWVSSPARDTLIASRGKTENSAWKSEMIIDEHKISHDFIIHDSELVAEKAASLIENIIIGTKQ